MTRNGAVDGAAGARWQAIDAARGLAIVAMIVFHAAWDLSYLRLSAVSVVGSPFWQGFARLIAGSFLVLAGVGLRLAHQHGVRWRPFGRRLVRIAGAAAGVTAATWLAFPDSFIFFGILHCIALSSVLALPFVRAPAWLAAAAAALSLTAPLLWTAAAFDRPALVWLGLGTRLPVTNDFVPVFPWFGLVLGGVALTRLGAPSAVAAGLAAWRAGTRPARALVWSGRHSLPIYLVHQPVLFGALFLVAQIAAPDPAHPDVPFLDSCRAACHEAGGEPDVCRAACACVAERLTVRDPARRTASDADRVAQVAEQCLDAHARTQPTQP